MPFWLARRTEPFTKYRLRHDGKTTIGREATQADIVLEDSSVSRLHATFRVAKDGSITLTDSSTFGTRVNSVRVQKDQVVTVRANDQVDFGQGRKSEFTLISIPITLCFSGLTTSEKVRMQEISERFGAKIHNDFDETVTHVVLPSKCWKVTSKVLQGMLNKKQIVSMDWVKQLDNNKLDSFPDPELFRPGPMSDEATSTLASVSASQAGQRQEHMVAPSTSDRPQPVFAPRPERTSVFSDISMVYIPLKDEQRVSMEIGLLRQGGATKFTTDVNQVATLWRNNRNPTLAIVCPDSVEDFRRSNPGLNWLPAVDKSIIIHAILTCSKIRPVPPPPPSPIRNAHSANSSNHRTPPNDIRGPSQAKPAFMIPPLPVNKSKEEPQMMKHQEPEVVSNVASSSIQGTSNIGMESKLGNTSNSGMETEPITRTPTSAQSATSESEQEMSLPKPRFAFQFDDDSFHHEGSDMYLPGPTSLSTSSTNKSALSTAASKTSQPISKTLAEMASKKASSARPAAGLPSTTKKKKKDEADLFDLNRVEAEAPSVKPDEVIGEEELRKRREEAREAMEERRQRLSEPPTDSGWLRKPSGTVSDDVETPTNGDDEARVLVEVEDLVVRRVDDAHGSISPTGAKSTVPGDRKRFRKNQVIYSHQQRPARKEVDFLVQSGLTEQISQTVLREEERKMLEAFGADVAPAQSKPRSGMTTMDEFMIPGVQKAKGKKQAKPTSSKKRRTVDSDESEEDDDGFGFPESSDAEGEEELDDYKPLSARGSKGQTSPEKKASKSELEEIFTDDEISDPEEEQLQQVASKKKSVKTTKALPLASARSKATSARSTTTRK